MFLKVLLNPLVEIDDEVVPDDWVVIACPDCADAHREDVPGPVALIVEDPA